MAAPVDPTGDPDASRLRREIQYIDIAAARQTQPDSVLCPQLEALDQAIEVEPLMAIAIARRADDVNDTKPALEPACDQPRVHDADRAAIDHTRHVERSVV